MNVKLRGLTKEFGSSPPVLDGLSISFREGEVIAVLGANGAGKTTLLCCLCGLLGVPKGTLFFDDEPFRRGDLDHRRKFIFQPDLPLVLDYRTPIDNVAKYAELWSLDGKTPKTSPEIATNYFERFKLTKKLARPLSELSRGELYKACAVGVRTADPDLWLLDEPFAAGMDAAGARTLGEMICEAATERGKTVLFTTQFPELALRWCSRFIVLRDGKVQMDHLKSELTDSIKEDLNRELGL